MESKMTQQVVNKCYDSVAEAKNVLLTHPDQFMQYFANSFKIRDKDLLQDMYALCLKQVETYTPGRPLHCYMHQTAKFVFLRSHRKNKINRSAMDNYGRVVESQGQESESPIATLLKQEQIAILTSTISCLSDRDRTIVRMHMNDSTLTEISDEVGLSVSRCQQILTEFKSKMKAKLSV
jgi:RNA polymerase sigma factor (sigma-70 family)